MTVCGLQFDVQTIEDRKILWAVVRKLTPEQLEQIEQTEEAARARRRKRDEEKRAERRADDGPAGE